MDFSANTIGGVDHFGESNQIIATKQSTDAKYAPCFWESAAEAAEDVLPVDAEFSAAGNRHRTLIICHRVCGDKSQVLFLCTGSGFFWQHNWRSWPILWVKSVYYSYKQSTDAKYAPCSIGFIIMIGVETNLICFPLLLFSTIVMSATTNFAKLGGGWFQLVVFHSLCGALHVETMMVCYIIVASCQIIGWM